jgi:hypothetical protein
VLACRNRMDASSINPYSVLILSVSYLKQSRSSGRRGTSIGIKPGSDFASTLIEDVPVHGPAEHDTKGLTVQVCGLLIVRQLGHLLTCLFGTCQKDIIQILWSNKRHDRLINNFKNGDDGQRGRQDSRLQTTPKMTSYFTVISAEKRQT